MNCSLCTARQSLRLEQDSELAAPLGLAWQSETVFNNNPLLKSLSSPEPPAGGRPGRLHLRKNPTITSRPGTLPSASYHSAVQFRTPIASACLFWDHRRPGPIHGRRKPCANLNLQQPTMYATRPPMRGRGGQCRTPSANITTHAYTGATRPPPVGTNSRGP